MRPTERLTKRLEALGYKVHKFELPQGHWRSSPYADCVRWEALVTAPGSIAPSYVASWDTVTTCARRGITIGGVGMSGSIEAHALAKASGDDTREEAPGGR